MVGDIIRGGVASVCDNRFFKANNRYVTQHNYNDYNTYGVLLDTNNLCWGITEKFPLPLNSFETVPDINLNKVLETLNDTEEGYFLEGDPHYSDRSHNGHEDFPLPPTKERIYYKSLGEQRHEQLALLGENRLFSQSKKPIQSRSDKKNYIVHYITPKLYVSIGIEVTKVHCAWKLKQS